MEKLNFGNGPDEKGKRNTLFISIMKSPDTGIKFIRLVTNVDVREKPFPKIAVPEDAYLVVAAMDTLMTKSVDDEEPPIWQEFVRDGLHYDYKLEICPHKTGHLDFWIWTFRNGANPTHQMRRMYFPIRLIPLLRDRMAEMLAEFDGSQEIGPCPPLPKWIPENDEIDGNNDEDDNERKGGKTIRLKKMEYTVDVEPRQRMFMIKLGQGISGRKYIRLMQQSLTEQVKFKNNSFYTAFPNISMPEDAYLLLNAMCALENELQEKYQLAMQKYKPSLICSQVVTDGFRCGFKLGIYKREDKQLEFEMKTITTAAKLSHKPKYLYGPIPIHVFKWMKNEMAKILTEYEELAENEKENIEEDKTSSQYSSSSHPKWIKENGNFVCSVDQKTKMKDSNEEKFVWHETMEHKKVDVEPLSDGWTPKNGTFGLTTIAPEKVNKEGKEIRFVKLKYSVDVEPRNRFFMVKMEQGISGRKYIRFTLKSLNNQIKFKNNSFYCDFPTIPLPEDAYLVLNAMRALENDLQEKHSNAMQQNNSSLICRQLTVGGRRCDYLLEIRRNRNQQFEFEMRTITTGAKPSHKPKYLEGPVPIYVFHWLKEQMAEMLTKYEELG